MLNFDESSVRGQINNNLDICNICINNGYTFNFPNHIKIITKVYNAVLAIADCQARKGIYDIQWKKASDIPEELKDEVGKVFSEGSNVLNVVKPLLRKICDINGNFSTINNDNFNINLAWKPDNKLLNPRPEFKLTTDNELIRNTYFNDLLMDESLSDVKIKIEEKILEDGKETVKEKFIPSHKIMLAQCPFFNTMFTTGEWKEKRSGEITIKECSYKTFFNFLIHIYKQRVSDGYFDDINNCLDMLKFANAVNYQPLVDLAKLNIYKLINEENFLQIRIFPINDKDIDKICRWFLQKNPKFGEGLDFSALSVMELIKTYEISKDNNVETLTKVSLETLKQKIALDVDFINLINYIIEEQNSELKTTFVEALKGKPEIMTALKEGKKGNFAEHWKVYKDLMTNLEI